MKQFSKLARILAIFIVFFSTLNVPINLDAASISSAERDKSDMEGYELLYGFFGKSLDSAWFTYTSKTDNRTYQVNHTASDMAVYVDGSNMPFVWFTSGYYYNERDSTGITEYGTKYIKKTVSIDLNKYHQSPGGAKWFDVSTKIFPNEFGNVIVEYEYKNLNYGNPIEITPVLANGPGGYTYDQKDHVTATDYGQRLGNEEAVYALGDDRGFYWYDNDLSQVLNDYGYQRTGAYKGSGNRYNSIYNGIQGLGEDNYVPIDYGFYPVTFRNADYEASNEKQNGLAGQGIEAGTLGSKDYRDDYYKYTVKNGNNEMYFKYPTVKVASGESAKFAHAYSTGGMSSAPTLNVPESLSIALGQEININGSWNDIDSEKLHSISYELDNSDKSTVVENPINLNKGDNNSFDYKIQVPPGKQVGDKFDVSTIVIDDQGNLTKKITSVNIINEAPKANPIFDNDNVVTGSGVAGQTIVVENDNGIVIGTSNIDLDGNYKVDINPQLSGTKLNLYQISENNSHSERVVIVVDGTKQPRINPVTSVINNITGVGVTNAKIDVYDSFENLIGSTFVNSDGTYSVEIDNQVSGNKLSVIQSDLAGNNSSIKNIVVDATMRSPLVNPIEDGATNITGGINSATPNANILIKNINNEIIGNSIVNLDGSYDVNVNKLKTGDTVHLVLADLADNFSPETNVIVGINNAKLNIQPILDNANKVSGKLGYAIPGAKIEVIDANGVQLGASVVASDGSYIVPTKRRLEIGEQLTVNQRDDANGVSSAIIIVAGNKKPVFNLINEFDSSVTIEATANAKIQVTYPNGKVVNGYVGGDGVYEIQNPEGYVFKKGDIIKATASDYINTSVLAKTNVGLETSVKINPINQGDKTISGTGIKGSSVIISFANNQTALKTNVAADGSWTITNKNINVLRGDIVIIKQNVADTNSLPNKIIVNGTETPTSTPVDQESNSIVGKGVPNAIVNIQYEGNNIGTSIIDQFGNYRVDVKDNITFINGNYITLVQNDGQNNSKSVDFVVGGALIPQVDSLYEDSKLISGHGTPNSLIKIDKINDTTIVDSKGNWSIQVPNNLKVGTEYNIIQNDGLNDSESVNTIVLSKKINESISGEDFKITAEQVSSLTEEEIISLANVQAIDLNSDEEVTIASVDYTKVKPEKGVYTIVFFTENGTAKSVNAVVGYDSEIEIDTINNESLVGDDFSVTTRGAQALTPAKAIETSLATAWNNDSKAKVDFVSVDLSQVKGTKGVYPITLTTAKGSTLTIKVLVGYLSDTVVGNNSEIIKSDDFLLPVEEVTTITDETLISKANIYAWNKNNRQNVAITVADKSSLKSEKGVYPVIFKTANNKFINVNVAVGYKGPIYYDSSTEKSFVGEDIILTSAEVRTLTNEQVMALAKPVTWNINDKIISTNFSIDKSKVVDKAGKYNIDFYYQDAPSKKFSTLVYVDQDYIPGFRRDFQETEEYVILDN